jgi:hypothetical protein
VVVAGNLGRGGGVAVKVRCETEEIDLEGDFSNVDGIQVTCGRCGHQTEAFGTSTASLRSCLVRLREECPRGESNFYVAAAVEED